MVLNMEIVNRLSEARRELAEIQSLEQNLRQNRDAILSHAWKLGGILADIKEEIGHGKWLFWLGGNWPELGERNARRCITFFKANEGWQNGKSEDFRGFDVDSIRKFMWGYIPVKERLELEGDVIDSPAPHHRTFINQFSKYDRQLRSGQIESFSPENFRRAIEPMIRRLIDLCGRDWFRSLLG
jgi:hypothetical protein